MMTSPFRRDHARLLLGPVLLLSLVGAGLFAFIELAEEVMEGETESLDRAVLHLFRDPADLADPVGPQWLEEAALEVTALGGYPIVTLLTLAVIGYLVVSRRGWSALYVGLSVAGGALLSTGLKAFFERPRPDLVEQLDVVHTASFPSGHATAITVTYLTLAALSMGILPTRRERTYVLAVAVIVSLLVGLTRVYLGVHWPSDVIAGWALGVAWASFAWCVVVIVERKDRFVALGREERAPNAVLSTAEDNNSHR